MGSTTSLPTQKQMPNKSTHQPQTVQKSNALTNIPQMYSSSNLAQNPQQENIDKNQRFAQKQSAGSLLNILSGNVNSMHSLITSNQAYTNSAKSLLLGGRRPASKLSSQQD